MNSRSIRSFAIAASVAVLAACGGGGGAASLAAGTETSVGIDKTADEFAFPNFGAKKSPEEFGTADVVSMFGDGSEVCASGSGDSCALTPEAATWARMVNQARQSGHCEGFAVMAAARFMQGTIPKTAELANEGDVTHGIMRGFATQFVRSVQEDANGWAKKSVGEKVAGIDAALRSGKLDYVLGVYTQTGGHAVLPWKIEYVDTTTARIHVYDSNWPGVDRYVTADVKNDSWSFSFSGKDPENDPDIWTGKSADMDMTSMEARSGGSCPFCEGDAKVKSSLFVIRAAALDWTVATKNGKLSPTQHVAVDDSARPLKAAGEPGANDYLINIQETADVTFDLPSETRLTGVTPGAAIEVQTGGGAPSQVSINESSVTSNDPGTVLTLASGNFVATANGATTELTATPGGITVNVQTSSGETINIVVNEQAPAVEIRTPGNPELGTQGGYQILTQTGTNEVTTKTVSATGQVTETKSEGTLSAASTSVVLPPSLQAPVTDPALPPPGVRDVIVETGTTTTSTTTTTVPVTTTTVAPKPTTTTSTSTSTTSTTTTTVPRTTTTTVPPTTNTVPPAGPWVQHLSAATNEQHQRVVTDANGNVYAIGYFCGRSMIVGAFTLYNADTLGTEGVNCDTYIEKINASGTVMWATRVGGAASDFPNSMAVDTSGNVYFIMTFGSTFTFAGQTMTYMQGANSMTMYGKLNGSGTPQWGKVTNAINGDIAASTRLVVTLAVPGPAGGATIDGTNFIGAGSLDAYVLDVNPTTGAGITIWRLTGAGTMGLSDVIVDSSNNIVVTGEFSGDVAFAGTQILNHGTNTTDVLLVKISTTNAIVYARPLGGAGNEYASYLSPGPNGDAFLAFESGGTSIMYMSVNYPVPVNGASKGMGILRVSPSGAVQMMKLFPVPSVVYCGGIAADSAGNVYFIGTRDGTAFWLDTQDPGPGAGGYDVFVFKMDTSGSIVLAANIGGTGNEYVQGGGGVAVDSAGYPVFAADSWSNSITIDGVTYANNGIDGYLVRATPNFALS